MPKSILEAIKMGLWNYEPETTDEEQYDATGAMPGTKEKVEVLAARARRGLPLWHDGDRMAYDEGADD